jgi:hypothetical protein
MLQIGNLLKKHKNVPFNTVTVIKINPAFTAVNHSTRYGVLTTMLLKFPTSFTKSRSHKKLLQEHKYVYILVINK